MDLQQLQEENQRLRAQNKKLDTALKAALEQIQELKARLGADSQNSNWPPSQDRTRKPKRKRSLRKATGRKAGGQAGHRGETLEQKAEADEIVIHEVEECTGCGALLNGEDEVVGTIRRQVWDIPQPRINITEHQVPQVRCRGCGVLNQAVFPDEVGAPVQYGPHLKQLVVYLKQYQFIPYDRCRQLIADLFGQPVSPGTLQRIVGQAATRLQAVHQAITTALTGAKVAHFDESGCYLQGERHWLHLAATPTLTAYQVSRYRGRRGTDAMGVLPEFGGVAVHDMWSAYFQYDHARHAVCHVHHLRELKALFERTGQPWTRRLQGFLLATKRVVAQARQRGLTTLPLAKQAQVNRLFDRLTQLALAANPPPATGWPQGQRGRPKKTKSRNFAERMGHFRAEMLRFAFDFKVPFDNNLAERDIRMLKVQQKISGCFRSQQGADDFCITRSYLSTMKKQGINVWEAIGSIFKGPLLVPDF